MIIIIDEKVIYCKADYISCNRYVNTDILNYFGW